MTDNSQPLEEETAQTGTQVQTAADDTEERPQRIMLVTDAWETADERRRAHPVTDGR